MPATEPTAATASPFTPDDALAVLKTVFGYPAFRGQQAEVVAHVAAGGNAFVLMPTGGGKSLCYQVPALLRGGVTVVISPLIALMQDQVAALTRRGVRAAMLNATLARADTARVERAVRDGGISLLYLSPERLVTKRCLSLLAASPLALFAIDEAHCISEWGHDFRPQYLSLSLLHERFPLVPRIALTATADAQTRAEIVQRLHLGDGRAFLSSFDRPNIRYRVVEKRNVHTQLLAFIRQRHAGQTGVVYCQSRTKVEETAAFLDAHGISALPYHAGLSASERQDNQAWFLGRRGVVMVATIAFGMGIDKADVRFVAHIDVPKSVEGYYQETGRAGRDGLPSDAWMAYSPHDAEPLYQQIRQSPASGTRRLIQASKLDAVLALFETAECRRVRLLGYFGESSPACGACDTCTNPPRSADATPAVRQLLACIKAARQQANAGQVIGALRANGRKPSEEEWRAIVRQCVALGIVAVDHETGGALTWTSESSGVFGERRKIVLRHWRAPPKATEVKHRMGRPRDQGTYATLLGRLRAWRADRARRLGVPVHVVFHDATLVQIARRQPRCRWTLGRIPGVGANKRAAFGDDILKLVTGAVARTRQRYGGC